jgi:hypothetical protein
MCMFFMAVLKKKMQSQKTAGIALNLKALCVIISNGMIKNLAETGISFFDLTKVCKQQGYIDLANLSLEKQPNNNPRVTKK